MDDTQVALSVIYRMRNLNPNFLFRWNISENFDWMRTTCLFADDKSKIMSCGCIVYSILYFHTCILRSRKQHTNQFEGVKISTHPHHAVEMGERAIMGIGCRQFHVFTTQASVRTPPLCQEKTKSKNIINFLFTQIEPFFPPLNPIWSFVGICAELILHHLGS